MDGFQLRDLLAAIFLCALALWGDALVDYFDPGRIDARIAYEQSQQAQTERALCEAFGTCVGKP